MLLLTAGDLDADGLADDWELHQLKSLTFGPTDDPDQDGAANASERQAGTDPANRADVLSLSYAATSPTTGLTLSWRHQASRSYQLETTEDWKSWHPISAPALRYPEPGVVEWTDWTVLTNGTRPQRFYRLNAKQP